MQLLAARGQFLRWLFEAAQKGDVGAIVVLTLGALAIAYSLWDAVIVHLIPIPHTPAWRRWRRVGFATLACLPLACVLFWLFIMQTMLVFFLPLLVVFASAWAAKKCREAKKEWSEQLDGE